METQGGDAGRLAVRRAASVLIGALLVALLCTAAPTAQAEDPPALVSVELSSFTPALPHRGGTITIAGTVTNTTDRPLYDLQAFFWRNQAPIIDREGLQAALASDADDPVGSRVTDNVGNPPSPSQNLLATGEPLRPGAKLTFSFSTPVSALELPSTDGVYLMGVQIRGNDNGTGTHLTLGRTRVLVPVVEQAPATAIHLAALVVLSSTPTLLDPAGKLFANENLAAEISPGGQLDQLLTIAGRSGNSYAIDPNLIRELQVMRTGYSVAQGDSKTAPGIGAHLADQWLARFAQLSTHDGYRLPYASIDLAALVHADRPQVFERAERAAARVSAVASLPLLIFPAGGLADAQTIKQAEDLNPAAILLSDAAIGSSSDALHSATGHAPILTFTSEAFTGGPGPDPQDTPVHLLEGMLASSWISAATASPGSALSSLRVITTPAQGTTELDAAAAPWLVRTPVTDLLSLPGAPWPSKFSYPTAAKHEELPEEVLSQVNTLAASYSDYTDLLADPRQASAQADESVARAASSWWRGSAADAGVSFIAAQSEQVAQVFDSNQVKLKVPNNVTLSGSSGVFLPATIVNDLDVPIKVRVQFTSSNAQRLRIPPFPSDPTKTLEIGAKQSYPVSVPAEPAANGVVPVVGQLITSTGTPIGRSKTINVNATNLGTVGILIAIGAGIVLVGSTAFRIRQVTRERGGKSRG